MPIRRREPSPLRPLWRCPECGHRFVTRNLWHSCARYRIAGHFKGRPAGLRTLFARYAAAVRSLGPVHVYAQKSRIVFQTRTRFAGAVVRRSFLEGALWLKRPVTHARFHRIEFIPPDNHIHYFRLRAPEDLEAGLMTLLREAYAVGCQRPRSRRGPHG